jgi:hypothetical protein
MVATLAFEQTQIVARLTASEVVRACGKPMLPGDPDTCIVLPDGVDPRKLWIMAGVVRWNLRRALVGALYGERITAACRNVLCVRADHLRLIRRRSVRAGGRSEHTPGRAEQSECGQANAERSQDDEVCTQAVNY